MGKRFVIVGNGVAGVTAAMTLRDRDDRADITLLSAETEYFFSRTALMYAFMNTLERRDMEPFERKVYRERRIERVFGRAVGLDAGARALTLQSGETLPYDALLLATGSVPRRLDAPGLTPDLAGLVHFVSMQDLDVCERFAPSTREAVVVGGGLIGIELVECLAHHGVRTTFLVREPWYWPVALCREEGEIVTAHLRAHGVDVRHDTEVGEVERDTSGRVAAVLTRGGERVACQMLGVCIGVEPGVDFLRRVKTPPTINRGIKVDVHLRTSLANVWAAGDCAEVTLAGGRTLVEQIWYSAKRQGALAGRNMSGRPTAYDPPLFFNSAKFFDVEYTTVGDLTRLPAGARAVFRKHPTKIITQRVVHHEGRVVGFNMLGSRWDHTVLSRWIDEARPLDWVLAHLARAQFDVELGRADLARMTEHDLAVETRAPRATATAPTAGAA